MRTDPLVLMSLSDELDDVMTRRIHVRVDLLRDLLLDLADLKLRVSELEARLSSSSSAPPPPASTHPTR